MTRQHINLEQTRERVSALGSSTLSVSDEHGVADREVTVALLFEGTLYANEFAAHKSGYVIVHGTMRSRAMVLAVAESLITLADAVVWEDKTK